MCCQVEASYTINYYSGEGLPKQYHALVYSKWLRSLRHGNDYFKLVDSDSYYKAYGAYIASILKRPEASVLLAVLTDDPDVCLGFSVREGEILHYVHVHRDQRGVGIGSLLMAGSIKTITHVTKAGLKVWNKKFPRAKFNPFA